MAAIGTAIDSATVVLKGSFIPQVLSPAWLMAKKLIGPKEYDAADVEVITRELSVFECGWLRVQTTRDSLQVSTAEPDEFERTRDVCVGILRELPDTPLGAMGINRAVHFTVGSVEAWHAVGDALAPKDLWEPALSLAGMRSLTMLGIRQDNFGGYQQVRVEPSMLVPSAVFIENNEHFDMTRVVAQPTQRNELPVWEGRELQADEMTADHIALAMEILSDAWSPSMARAQAVVERLTALGRQA